MEKFVIVEAFNGVMVRLPESKLSAWQAEQTAIKKMIKDGATNEEVLAFIESNKGESNDD